MRVLLINTSERTGGAAIAASRLMDALISHGIKAKLLVRDKQTTKISVVKTEHNWIAVWNFVWERIVIWIANRFSKKNLFAVDIANVGMDITSLPEFKQADIIHLHWINQGMLSLKSIKKILKSGKPVVWTMHDMWPFTGICHHARECDNYKTECRDCFYLNGTRKKDLSTKVFNKKKKILAHNSITFIGCSKWIAAKASESSLTINQQVLSIPNPINTNLFKPSNKLEARKLCNLPQHAKLILFGSVKIRDKRKGVDYFVDSCKILASKYPELCQSLGIVVFGHHSSDLQERIPFKIYPMEYVKSEHELISIYNSVDLYVTPSLEDNLPNTIMEAMACGIPCVGFQVGGIPEMIDHLHNGYIAEYKSADDLANGIHWVLEESDYKQLSEEAVRKVINNYSERTIAKKYIEIYNKVIGTHA
ncbi:glycosyltransferase family 4 protein [Bacteroides sp. 519]|uniref:glycosyltransferase family 4 protein n=1 Tax=Bacteroides sp. 519 TaxID=2302937 RepID=UPI0013D5BACD|nr:glycosyltransferase family 4 protein [Bacteroides sp. 519]NDV60030.1 glycosyltransferase [Bacteroides sp. 519]